MVSRPDSDQLLEYSKNLLLKGEEFPINEVLNELTFEISYSKDRNYEFKKHDILKQYNQISFDYIQLEEFLKLNKATKINSNGIILLMNPLFHRQDKMYSDVLEKVLEKSKEIDHHQPKHPLALVMNNCERSEIFLARPDWLIEQRLPFVKRILDIFEREGAEKNIGYFSFSVFGLTPPDSDFKEPNSIMIARGKSIIRDIERWQPFGVLDPIYWFLLDKNQ